MTGFIKPNTFTYNFWVTSCYTAQDVTQEKIDSGSLYIDSKNCWQTA